HILAARDLDGGVVLPERDRIPPGLHPEAPEALRGDRDIRAVPVRAGHQLAHGDQRLGLAIRADQRHASAEHLVSLAEHGGGDGEGLAGYRLGWTPPAVHDGLDVKDGDSSDHHQTLPSDRSPARGGPGQKLFPGLWSGNMNAPDSRVRSVAPA